MKKSSLAITLALVSSVVLPFGCSRQCKDKLPDGRPSPNCSGSHHGAGAHFIPGGGLRGGTSPTTTTGSPRGGFGGTAGAHSGSGA